MKNRKKDSRRSIGARIAALLMVFMLCMTGGSTMSYADTGSTGETEVVGVVSDSVNAVSDEVSTKGNTDTKENAQTDNSYSEEEAGTNAGGSTDVDSADHTDNANTGAADSDSASGNEDSAVTVGESTSGSTEVTADDSTSEVTGAVADNSTGENSAANANGSAKKSTESISVNNEGESDDDDAAAEDELDAVSAADAGLTTFIWEDDEKVVTVCLSDPDALPEGAGFVVEDLTQEEYEECRDLIIEQQFANNSDYGETEEERIAYAEAALQNLILYDMHFVYEGEEIEPDRNTMSVTIEFKTAVSLTTDEIVETDDYIFVPDEDAEEETVVLHIEETADGENVADVTEKVEADDNGAIEEIEFTVDSFSVFSTITVGGYITVEYTDDTLIDDYGGSYTLYYILNNYNIFSSGDVTAYHTVGAVAVGGEAAFPSSIGSSNYTITVPSYFAGDITEFGDYSDTGGLKKHAMYLTDYDDTLQTYLYERVTFNDGTVSPFIDFNVAMAAIEKEMSGYVNSKSNITVDPDVESDYYSFTTNNNGEGIVNLESGYSYVFDSFDSCDYINIIGDDNVNIICTAGGTHVLPEVIVNGEKINGSETDAGCGVTFLLPNAKSVDVGSKIESGEFFGHVVAPNAEVYSSKSGNTNGSFICASFNVPSMENHMWHYTGSIITPDSQGFTASKTLDGKAPTDADDEFSFTLSELKLNDNHEAEWEVLQTKTSAYDTGLVTFNSISYSEEGTHWYMISEVQGDTAKYTFDSTEYLVEVVVTKETETTESGSTTTTYTSAATYYKLAADIDVSALVVIQSEITTENGKEITSYTVRIDTSDSSKLTELKLEGAETSETPDTSKIFTFGNTTVKGSLWITKNVTINDEKTASDKADGTYTFYVKNSSGTIVRTVKITIENGVSETVKVKNLPVGMYTVEEDTSLNPDGMKLKGDNDITVTVTKDGTAEVATAEFTNNINEEEYTASGDLVLEVSKKLETDESTMSLSEGQFEFKITQVDQKGNSVKDGYTETKSIDKDGKVTFEKPNAYSLADVGKTYYYTVEEVIPDSKVNGFTYDTKVYTVAVSITDNGDGTLNVVPSYTYSDAASGVYSSVTADTIIFTNKYETKGAITLSAKKTLNYKILPDQEFCFEIVEMSLNENGVLAEKKGGYSKTATNDANGSISFPEISYSQSGTYYYKITEQDGGKSYYSYDSNYYIVIVEVEDNGKGKLNTEITDVSHYSKDGDVIDNENNDVVFTNDYITSGSVAFTATKTVEGRALKDQQFTFEITEVDARGTAVTSGYSGTVKNAADGTVSFLPEITYSKTGTYYYQIAEVNDGQKDYAYDARVYTAKVVVTDNGNGKLATDISYTYSYSDTGSDSVPAESVAFENTFEGVVADFSFIKVNDQDPTQGIEGSEYGLFDEKGELITTVVSDASGLVAFGDLDVNVPYTIKELDPPAGSYVSPEEITFVITYDDATKVMAVDIKDNGEGTLVQDDDGNYVWLEAQTIVSALKTDEDSNPLAGAVLQIQDEDGNPVVIGTDESGEEITSWVTTSEAKRITSILDTGKVYYLVELEAPDGYEIADPIEFVIKDEAVAHDAEQVVELVMVDEKSTTTTTTTTEKTTKKTTTTTAKKTAKASTSKTKTGDATPVMPYVIMILAALAVAVGVIVRRRRIMKNK